MLYCVNGISDTYVYNNINFNVFKYITSVVPNRNRIDSKLNTILILMWPYVRVDFKIIGVELKVVFWNQKASGMNFSESVEDFKNYPSRDLVYEVIAN